MLKQNVRKDLRGLFLNERAGARGTPIHTRAERDKNPIRVIISTEVRFEETRGAVGVGCKLAFQVKM